MEVLRKCLDPRPTPVLARLLTPQTPSIMEFGSSFKLVISSKKGSFADFVSGTALHIRFQVFASLLHLLELILSLGPDVDLKTFCCVFHLVHSKVEVHRHLRKHLLQLIIGRQLHDPHPRSHRTIFVFELAHSWPPVSTFVRPSPRRCCFALRFQHEQGRVDAKMAV